MYENRIAHLKEMHKSLNKQIDNHEKNHPHSEETIVHEWKKKRLALKDEISRLERLQWEHNHESVNFDDDR